MHAAEDIVLTVSDEKLLSDAYFSSLYLSSSSFSKSSVAPIIHLDLRPTRQCDPLSNKSGSQEVFE